MKANQVSAEELLRGIPREQWALGWEAIMDATRKDIDFATQGRIFAYIKTYIYRKEFQEKYYLQRKKNKKTGKVERTYIMRSLPVTHAMAVYGVSELNKEGNSNYNDMIGGAYLNGDIAEAAKNANEMEEIELRCDLSALGIPDYFIDRILEGERLFKCNLTREELLYLEICRQAYSSLRSSL